MTLSRNIRHVWAYMFLGQVVAISVASNLFYIALSLSPSPPVKNLAFHPVVWLSVLISLLAVGCTPFTTDYTFLPNLLLMHILAMVPLVCGNLKGKGFAMSARMLHTCIFFISLCFHISNALPLFSTFDQPSTDTLWNTLFSHPAQSSIGWDVIWTSASFVVWSITSNHTHGIVSLLTPFFSVGVSASVVALLNNRTHLGLAKTE